MLLPELGSFSSVNLDYFNSEFIKFMAEKPSKAGLELNFLDKLKFIIYIIYINILE